MGTLAHDVMHDLVEHVGGRGRPNITWLNDIAEWTGIGITTWVREAEERQRWRRLVVSSKCPDGRPRPPE